MHTRLPSLAAASLVAAIAMSPIAALANQDKTPEFRRRNVAIVIYPGVELLDFAGPGEVFAVAHGKNDHAFRVYTVARSKEPVTSMGFVTITPQYTLEDCPEPDIVVVPGGDVPGGDETLREWVRARSKHAELMMSVCNGALVYAHAGLLRGLTVTTHHSALQALAMFEPEAQVLTNRRFVDNGRVLTAAGIAAGIDGALHVVERFCGQEAAWQAARQMEYDWRPDEITKLHAQAGTPVDNAEGLRLVGSIRRLGAERALAELRKLEKVPDEKQLNTWGYWLLGASQVDEAVGVFRMASQAFPQSANAFDSLGEALEAKSDKDGALSAARECLALLEKGGDRPERERKLLHNASASRIARLTGTAASKLRFVCPPCGRGCDSLAFIEDGPCPNCSMQLVERSN